MHRFVGSIKQTWHHNIIDSDLAELLSLWKQQTVSRPLCKLVLVTTGRVIGNGSHHCKDDMIMLLKHVGMLLKRKSHKMLWKRQNAMKIIAKMMYASFSSSSFFLLPLFFFFLILVGREGVDRCPPSCWRVTGVLSWMSDVRTASLMNVKQGI